MLNILCVSYIVLMVFLHFWIFLKKISIATKTYKIFLLLLGFAFAFLASQINPPHAWDLYRHYNLLDLMRIYGLDFVLGRMEYGSVYADLFVINFFFYFVSLTEHNGLLVFIPTVINYSIFTYVTCDLTDKGTRNRNLILLVNFFTFLALVNIMLAVVGIRNVLAFNISALAVYLDVYKRKRGFLKYLLYILPLFIHPASVIFIIIRIISGISMKSRKYKFAPLLIFWEVLLIPISFILNAIPLGVFQEIGGRLLRYNEIPNSINLRVAILSIVFIIAVLYTIFYWLKKDQRSRFIENERYISFILIYLFTTLGGMSTGVIFERLLYGLAIFLLPLVYLLFDSHCNHKRAHAFLIITVGICILIYYNQFLRFYNGLFRHYDVFFFN